MNTKIDVSPPPVSQRPSWSRATCSVIGCAALCFGLTGAAAAAPASDRSPIPAFEATSLTGRTIHRDDLIGQTTVLIVTPGRDAAASTRAWAKALREAFQGKVRLRDVLAVDLPFFMDESDAIGRAKKKIPQAYHDQTWLTSKDTLASALGVDASARQARVFVLDAQGRVVREVDGDPTPERLDQLQAAVRSQP